MNPGVPSLDILGGQAVQADRLLHYWRGDPDVDAWLVPVNPRAPGPLAHAQRVKYVRTAVTQALYWPSLVRQLRRADLVHVFSASYTSFLLAPWPAVRVARLCQFSGRHLRRLVPDLEEQRLSHRLSFPQIDRKVGNR